MSNVRTGATPTMTRSEALGVIAAGASEADRDAGSPEAGLTALARAGLLSCNAIAGASRPPAAGELSLVREVARADSSIGRIFDGHLNATERLAVHAPHELASRELSAIQNGQLRAGVWGGDPREGEGVPATLESSSSREMLTGVKTFCSGAGSLDRALVLTRETASKAPVLVWIDVTDETSVEIDVDWYRSSGLRASASHRVVFHRAPVLARVGGPGAISAQPWFGRDGLRTAASWAGMADRAVDAACVELARRRGRGTLEALAVGRMLACQRTISAWLTAAATAMDACAPDLWDLALHARVAIADLTQTILAQAAAACGSHPFATGGDLDRVRRDLNLFLLQHRLDSGLAKAGAAALDAIAGAGR